MCLTCGCEGDEATLSIGDDNTEHSHTQASAGVHEHVHADGTRHSHSHSHASAGSHKHADGTHHSHTYVPVHEHPHQHEPGVQGVDSVHGKDSHTIALEARILGKNQLIAERNRGWFAGRGILALNLVSGPGAGKTTLLEHTLTRLKAAIPINVVEGDQATAHDAKRIRATGVPAVQVNTGTGCHLEADMLERALALLKPPGNSLLLIENVGNLVCPALFDLGEHAKVVIFSVTEGEDKPLKYPHMFRAAAAMVLSKTDLLPHLRFDAERAVSNALTVNPALKVFRISAYSGAGMTEWYEWLHSELAAHIERNEPSAKI